MTAARPLAVTVDVGGGPPAPGGSAADVYRDSLPHDTPHYEFPLHALDRTGVPVYYAALWTAAGAACSGVGYGGTDALARTSALGELTETHAMLHGIARAERRSASYAALVRHGVSALDPLRARLPVGTTYAPDRPLQWVEARRYPSGEPCWVPLELAASNVGDTGPGDWLFTPITNGLGAGDTAERALAHGLLELVQRDGNSLSYRALDQGVVVELDAVADAETRALLARLDAEGIDVMVKLAATSFGITNLYVVGADRDPARAPHPVMLTACGEAAHPDRERALHKALHEFCSSRVRKRFAHGSLDVVGPLLPGGYRERLLADPPGWDEEPRALAAMRDLMRRPPAETVALIRGSVLSERRRVRFSELPTVPPGSLGSQAALLADVAERLARAGLEILYVDVTPPGSAARAVKVIVPELEVEGMSYHRVGPRGVRLLAARGDGLAGVGAPPAGAARVPLTAADEAALGGPAWFHVERAAGLLGDLYALYREPGEHVLAFAGADAGAS